MQLDHLAIAAETLEEGVAWAQERLGVTFGPIGKHDHFGTHNRLIGIDHAMYLEVIAVDPAGRSAGPRWFDLDNFSGPPRLANWICEPDDFDTALAHGMQSVPMQRGAFTWNMGVRPDGRLPMDGAFPTLLQWHTDAPPGIRLARSGFQLAQLVVSHPEASDVAAQLKGSLSDPRVVFKDAPAFGLQATLTSRDRVVTL